MPVFGGFRVVVTSNLDEVLSELERKLVAKVPAAWVKASNQTAATARDAVRDEMRSVFDRPTPFTLNSVVVRPATAANPEAAVAIKDTEAHLEEAHYLLPNIEGGKRLPKRFENRLRAVAKLPDGMFAVPGQGARLDAYGNISAGQIVDILSFFRTFREAGFNANATPQTIEERRQGRTRRLGRGRGNSQKQKGYAYFVGRPGRGLPLGVWKRTYVAGGTRIAPILIFVNEADYQPIFDFEGVCTRVANRDLAANFDYWLRRDQRAAA